MTERKDGVVTSPLQEAKQLGEEFREVPMADVLIDVFFEHADPKSFRIDQSYDEKEILARYKSEEFDALLVLGSFGNREVYFEIFSGSSGLGKKIDFERIAIFRAGQKETGTWAEGRGYQQTFNIRAEFDDLYLPSRKTEWVFGVYGEIAQKTNERYLLRQPIFWPTESAPEPDRTPK